MTTGRTSAVIRHELHVAYNQHQEFGFLVREDEWYAMSSGDQHHVRTWADERGMEIIVVDDEGAELYRL